MDKIFKIKNKIAEIQNGAQNKMVEIQYDRLDTPYVCMPRICLDAPCTYTTQRKCAFSD